MDTFAIAGLVAIFVGIIFSALSSTAAASTSPLDDHARYLKIIASTFHAYLMRGGRDKITIAKAQEIMTGLTVDGIAGPLTHKRVEQILGFSVAWPSELDESALPPKNTVYPKKSQKSGVKCPPCDTQSKQDAPFFSDFKPVSPAAIAPSTSSAIVKIPTSAITKTTPDKPVPKPTTTPVAEPGPLESLFSVLTSKPATSAAKPAAAAAKPYAAAAVRKPAAAKPATSAAKPAAAKPATAAATNTQRTAANKLHAYYTSGGRVKTTIAPLQQLMGSIAADGIVGPATASRIKTLTGKTLVLASKPVPKPAPKAAPKAAPKSTNTNTQKTAANNLANYHQKNGRDKKIIANYQRSMGGVTADGIVGPVTKSRIQALTGRQI